MLQLLKVSGESLAPDYLEGDFVLIAKIPFLLNRLKVGDVIAFRHPDYGLMIKRIAALEPGRGNIFVTGTHQYSVDSRYFGTIERADLVGKVIWHSSQRGQPR